MTLFAQTPISLERRRRKSVLVSRGRASVGNHRVAPCRAGSDGDWKAAVLLVAGRLASAIATVPRSLNK